MRKWGFVTMALGGCLVAGVSGCDDETASAPDCRQEANRCIEGLACVESGGSWECLPVRDGRVMPMPEDGGMSEAGMVPTPDGGSVGDAEPDVSLDDPDGEAVDMGTADPSDMTPPPDDMAPPVEDVAPPVEDVAPPVEDVAPPVEDVAPAVEDMAPPIEDMAPPVEDMAPPVEDMAPPVEDMAPPPMFGPGRCNHQQRIQGDDDFEPNPDQNSATAIELGRHEALVLRGDDSDWYRLRGACVGGRFEISLDHPFDGGDIDLQVWAGGGRVIHSQGLCTGHEEGSYEIEAGVDQIIIGVYPFGPPGRAGDNTYDLEIQMACP